ncbi:MAG: 1-acyl-sn-glycerol-3-phosphate acyltransferase [Colwellia sp.]|nr:1-acyl-sn-glycerol-3-phosphate acyltransferase [Colwellia sp.]
MLIPNISPCVPRARGGLSKWVGLFILKTLGWKIAGELPANKKFVMAIAPHTSNWDFVICVAVMLALNLRVKFMGKDAIFIWPIKGILIRLGGIAIHRSSKQGVIAQMVQQFEQQEQLILAIAPEGTRSKTIEWKKGFLLIASQAKVPVVPVSLDYRKKEITLLSSSYIGDDIDEELVRFKLNFVGVCAKKPQAV